MLTSLWYPRPLLCMFAGLLALAGSGGCDSTASQVEQVQSSSGVPNVPPPPPGSPAGDAPAAIVPGTGKLKRIPPAQADIVEFALNGQRRDDEVLTPYFLITSRNHDPATDKQQAVVQLAERLSQGLPNRQQRSVAAVTIHGLEGYELIYDAEDSVSRTPMFLYYVGLFQGSGFYFLHGSAEKSAEAEWLPEYRAMVQGWRPAGQ